MNSGRRTFRDLFGRRSALEGQAADSASSPQTRLDIARSATALEFLCTSPRICFFRLDARLAGVLSMSRALSEDRIPTVRVEIPIEARGKRDTIVLIYCAEDGQGEWPLVEASTLAGPGGARVLRFVFGDGRDRVLYSFTLPSHLEVVGFEPLERVAETAFTPPSVGQLAAVLRTTLKDRRDALAVVDDLGAALSASTVKAVEDLRTHAHGTVSLATPRITALLEQWSGPKRPPSPLLLGALCLLLDLEAGYRVSLDTLEFSPEAIATVQAHFQGGGAPSAPPVMQTAMQALAARMARPRDPLVVLANLVRESSTPRTRAVHLAENVALPPLEGLQALVDLVAASGRRMDPATITAFCLYAQIESGSLDDAGFKAWMAGSRPLALALYSLQAVAMAFDIPLLGVTVPPDIDDRVLFELSPAGLVETYEDPDGMTRHRFRARPEGVEGRRLGHFMLRISVIERATDTDLDLFLRLGNSFYACFQSDLDRRRLWRLMTPDDAAHTFVDGFRVYHFQGSVMAEMRAADVDALGVSPLVCKDHRNSLHFFDPESPPQNTVMREAGLVVHFPLVTNAPQTLSEMGFETLLGRVQAGTSDVRKLELLRAGMRSLGTIRSEFAAPMNAAAVAHMRAALEAPRLTQALRGMVDVPTLEFLLRQFLKPDAVSLELRLFAPLMRGLRSDALIEIAAIALLFEMCESEHTTTRTFHKNFKRQAFRAALRNHLLAALDTHDDRQRATVCRVLATAPCMGEGGGRDLVEYELLRRLEEPSETVAVEAAAALVRLALSEERALPAIWHLKPVEVTPSPNMGQHALLVMAVGNEIKTLQMRLAALMVGGKMPPRPSAASMAMPTGGLKDMAQLVVGFRTALPDGGTGGWVVVTTKSTLENLLRGVVDSLTAYAEEERITLEEVAQEIREQGLGGYLGAFAASPAAVSLRSLDSEEESGGLESFRGRLACTPTPLWVEDEGRVNPAVMSLLRRGVESGLENVRLARLPLERRISAGLPIALYLQVYDAEHATLIDFVDAMLSIAQFHCTAAEQDVLAAVAGAMPRISAERPEVKEEDEGEVLDAFAAASGPIVLEEEKPEILLRARRLIKTFALPETYLTQVLYVIHGR